MTDGRAVKVASRDRGIDFLRGVALISMISSHMNDLTLTGVIGRVLHSAVWIDGAFFFVALSGVVTGLVHRRVVDRAGYRASARKLARRAGFLYLVHVALALTILVAHNVDPDARVIETPTWRQAGGIVEAIERVLVLRLEPNFNTVLPMYVALLIWAIGLVWLLRRGLWVVVVALSLSVYLFGQFVNGLAFSEGGFPVADWQLLFTGGLLVGWSWEHERLRLPAPARRWIVSTCVAVALGLYVATRAFQRQMYDVFGSALEKFTGGWLAFLFAGTMLVTGYVVVRRSRGVPLLDRASRPIEVMGSKGLPGYVTMVLAILVIDFIPAMPRNDLTVILVASVCALAEYASVHYFRRRHAPIALPLSTA